MGELEPITAAFGIQWTPHQSITGPHTKNKQPCTFIPVVNLEHWVLKWGVVFLLGHGTLVYH